VWGIFSSSGRHVRRVCAPRGSRRRLEVLTPRELDVLRLLGTGMTDTQITEEIGARGQHREVTRPPHGEEAASRRPREGRRVRARCRTGASGTAMAHVLVERGLGRPRPHRCVQPMMSAGAGLPQGRVVDDVVTIVMRRHVRRSVHSGQCRRPQARCDGKINKNARAMMVGQSAAQ